MENGGITKMLIKGRLINIERLDNSINGNPKFKFIINENGYLISGKTATDGFLAYHNLKEGDKVILEYHFSRRHLIFTNGAKIS